ncbi:MAG: putative glycosyltransferase (family 2) [Candidatus Angelobacter sp.]|nr:putative glycosyltransferase (family 2) [Candidatus Angelobacter sp.]
MLSPANPQKPDNPQLPRVCIIVLTWKNYDLTRDCLSSLRRIDYSNVEIVLVDNGSGDGSAERLASEFPEVRLIHNETNLGFPAGNNVAIRDAMLRNPDYFLLLNNDTLVASDFLSKLVKVAESDEKIGLVNPKILYFEPDDRIWYGGGFYKPWWSTGKVRGQNRRDLGNYNETTEVSFVTGCACLIKAEVVRKIGLLDESFFLGFEDLDWTLRAMHGGFRAFYVGSAVIWHKASYDTRKNLGKPTVDFYRTRNSLLLARKHVPLHYWPGFLLSFSKYVVYRSAGYMLRAEPKRIRELYRGIWNGCVTKI